MNIGSVDSSSTASAQNSFQVAVLKKQQDQQAEVAGRIIANAAENVEVSRENFDTGRNLDVAA